MPLIEARPEIPTLELADDFWISLGYIKYQLKVRKERGVIKVGNFFRSDNKLAYAYSLTQKGLADKLTVTRHLVAYKRNGFALLRIELEQ